MASKANIGAKITLEGEKEYRQAISGVSKSMNVLKSELKAVAAEYADNANSLDALRAKNEILARQQSQQEEKLKLLRGALESVSSEYGENSKQAQDWQIKLNNAYSELSKINKELGENQKYMKEAEDSTDKTARSIDEFGNKVKETKSETLKFGDVLKANLASQAIVNGIQILADKARDLAVAMVDVVKSTASYADGILAMSTNTGISTDKLQELNYMAELTDTSLDTITSTMAKNIRSMNSAANGTKLYTDAYKQLGIEITDSNGKLLDSETIFWQAIDALGSLANETERDALAMQIFGRSAQDLNSLIAIGSDGVARFSQEARDMGAVLSGDTLKKLGETDDAFQRLTQQWEISKRTIGSEMAPAMTKALGNVTEKIGEVDDKFADFAGGAMTDVADGFIWLIDNVDVVTSLLKGLAAAIVTKKAAEGIEYAVTAYKALTTATEAATAAQAANNVVSKASAIGAIAGVVIGLGTALYAYGKSARAATEEMNELNNASEKLLETSKELREETDKSAQNRKESADKITAEGEAVKKLANSLYDLADKENKTSQEKAQMISLVDQLNEAIPELNLSINEQTGFLSLQRTELENLISKQLEYNMIQAAQTNLQSIANEKFQSEKKLNDLISDRTNLMMELQKAEAIYNNYGGSAIDVIGEVSEGARKAWENLKIVKTAFKENGAEIELTQQKIKDLSTEYDKDLAYIGDNFTVVNDAIATNSANMSTLVEQFKKSIKDSTEDAVDSVDDALKEINDKYDEAGEALEKKLDKEQRVFEKAQEAKVKAVEDAQDKEYKALEKSHKKKLKLINEEYLEKMKLVNEDRYKELKKVQDQIDDINTQQEAEDRAAKLKEEAEKRAELTAKINTAATIEDKMEAQQDLADFEADVAADRLKTERSLQKDILEEQKDSINNSYDAKIKALEKAQEKEETKLNTDYENEKKAIDKRFELTKAALKEEQELEKESFKDKQEEQKKFLSVQKDQAIKTAKEIYAEDLRQYKLNNALKEDINYDATFGYVKEQAIKDLYSGKNIGNATKILNAKTLEEMLKYYTPNTSPSNTQTPTIDYTEMGKEMTKAVKNLKLTVMLNGKAVGAMVQENVYQMLK